MISKLPLSIDDLLRQRTVEGERIEYKAGWNPDAVVRTLCAFANDFENLGGGYVVGSELHEDAAGMPLVELGRRMNIVDGADEFARPRNVGVLFFHDEPRRFLPGAQIDVVIFPDGPGGDVIVEKSFHGPLHEQVRDALRYIESNALRRKIVKRGDRAEADRILNYPFPAVEESLVNAVYHRGYDQREPVEVRVNPDGIEIVSYPGPRGPRSGSRPSRARRSWPGATGTAASGSSSRSST